MEEGRRQTHSQVGGSHLVFFHSGRDITQEVQECLENLTVLIRQEHDGGLNSLEALILGNICRAQAATEAQ